MWTAGDRVALIVSSCDYDYPELQTQDSDGGLNGTKKISSGTEREFDAYYKSLTNSTLPAHSRNTLFSQLRLVLTNESYGFDKEGKKISVGNYYESMTESKKNEYSSQHIILMGLYNKLKK